MAEIKTSEKMMLVPDLSGAARALAAAAREAGRIIDELVKVICPVIREIANGCLIMLWRDRMPGKWVHFYLHSRKYRVRKKYQKMILRRIAELTEGGAA